uniref:Bm2766 n=1 Tax=Brugia malayi TaxID=6279 RepID=A0A0H5RZH1_BRUMA|nr:Bm2766 [Brugia malayi]
MISPVFSNSSKSKNDASGDSSAFQKNIANLYHSRRKLATLMGEKRKWLNCQRKASLLVQPYKIDELEVMSRFAPLLSDVSTAQLPNEQHQAQLALIEQIIQESIIIEWPKMHYEKCPDDDNSLVGMELDFAPLIHRARNVVKCRTSHPTMRVRVCAIAEPNSDMIYPRVVEAFFRATLVKLSGDPGDRQTAGRLILTQREGTSATKYHDQHGVVVNMNGRLLISQVSPECSTNILSEQYGENVKRTNLKYEHGTLCAIFPELGVTLNSMIDRRQLSTRYAIQIDVALNIENKLIVKHHNQPSDQEDVTSNSNKQKVPWGILKKALKYFVKAQLNSARALDTDELLHVQCMLFYPRIRKANEEECEQLEKHLFGNIKNINEGNGVIKLKHRLLTEMVIDSVLVSKNELMVIKDFKQGIAEILMDESFLKSYDRIVQLQTFDGKNRDESNLAIATPLKTTIFHDYNTMRLQNNCVETRDNETIRVNPLTGEKLTHTQNNVNNVVTSNSSHTTELSSLVQSYVELLLHASSFYTVFNGTSTSDSISGDSTSDKESDGNVKLEQRRLENNNINNVTRNITTDGAVKSVIYSHSKEEIRRVKCDSMNISKRIYDERWMNENDELEALDLTEKRTKLNES